MFIRDSVRIAASGLAMLLALAAGQNALAQQATIGVPHPVVGDSFFEQIGTSWGVRGRGWFFNFGGPAVPPFGGFDPNAGANFGFAGPHGFFNFSAGQGANSMFGSQTPMVTLPNGGIGAINDQIYRPFVTGIIPVVGDAPSGLPSTVLQERLMRLNSGELSQRATSSDAPAAQLTPPAGPSTADRGELSVAEINARKAAEKSTRDGAASAEIAALVEKARGAIADGQPGVAKVFLQMAARRAEGDQRGAIQKQLDALK